MEVDVENETTTHASTHTEIRSAHADWPEESNFASLTLETRPMSGGGNGNLSGLEIFEESSFSFCIFRFGLTFRNGDCSQLQSHSCLAPLDPRPRQKPKQVFRVERVSLS